MLFAGTALSVGMLGALLIAPGALLVSATMGVIVAAVLAVLVALFAMPAGLALLGTNINRWQFGLGRAATTRGSGSSERALRKPGVAAFFVLLPLLVLVGAGAGARHRPAERRQPAAGQCARARATRRSRSDRGAGWSTPLRGRLPHRADRSRRAQAPARSCSASRSASRELPGVEAVLGPAALRERTAVLRQITRQIVDRRAAARRGSSAGCALRCAARAGCSDGLRQGAAGAERSSPRASGRRPTAPARSPAARRRRRRRRKRLADGVAQTRRRAPSGSADARRGGARAAPSGCATTCRRSARLAAPTRDRHSDTRLNDPLNRAQSAVQSALRNLGTISPAAAADPQVQRASADVQRALAELGPLKTNVTDYTTELNTNALAAREITPRPEAADRGPRPARLRQQAARGRHRPHGSGLGRPRDAESTSSAPATSQLDDGLDTLLDGPGGNGGAIALAAGLDDAAAGSDRHRPRHPAAAGRRRARAKPQRQAAGAAATQRHRRQPGGFLRLLRARGGRGSATPDAHQRRLRDQRRQRRQHGARDRRPHAAAPSTPDSIALRDDLERLASDTAKELDARRIVGGPAVLLDDFDQATTARFPFLVLTLVLVTFLVLLIVFRSPVLAFCAVILNLVTVGAAVGVLIICFQSDPPLLGRPGLSRCDRAQRHFAIIFGLSIDYEVFLISRLLEGRAITGTTEGAIRYSLEKTATIITGAAFIMAAVFLAFAVSPVTNTRQFGIGLTVAVLLDATVVRLILLPALIRLFGERTWDVPAWLDRILPRFSAH